MRSAGSAQDGRRAQGQARDMGIARLAPDFHFRIVCGKSVSTFPHDA
jgi:hypothetical protein